MGFTLKEICEAVGGYTEGDATIIVNSVAEPGLASDCLLYTSPSPRDS